MSSNANSIVSTDLRQHRRRHQENSEQKPTMDNSQDNSHPTDNGNSTVVIQPGTYWLTRIVLLRYLCFIYFVAFLVAFNQNVALIGKRGLLPAHLYLNRIRRATNGINIDAWSYAPTLMWLFDYTEHMDSLLTWFSGIGLLLSGFVVITGCANMIMMFALWVLYHSIVSVGQRWYSFGWESQLLESGFLGIWLCPLWRLDQIPRQTPPPWLVIWGFRWLIFRIMIGAGMIKLRGDKCWWDLTCMHYHYETQPVPNAISPFMHQTPGWFHKIEVLTNHFVELLAPIFLLVPYRPTLIAGGTIQILFQAILIISGNLSFLNWLTILPSLACFDDSLFQSLFWSTSRQSAKYRVYELQAGIVTTSYSVGYLIRNAVYMGLFALLAYLSIPVVRNLLSSDQAMNTSFDPLRLVNTYGAFGSITKRRSEVILQGTYASDPFSHDAEWLEYEFKVKPGGVDRRPRFISPYHYRLDWLMWFAAFQSYQYNPWLVHLVGMLLANDPVADSLIDFNPFKGRKPPKFVRCVHYRYRYIRLGQSKTDWWHRELMGEYMPPVQLAQLREFYAKFSWVHPADEPPPPPPPPSTSDTPTGSTSSRDDGEL